MDKDMIGEAQNRWKQMDNNEIGRATSEAKEIAEKFNKLMNLDVKIKSQVTIYDDFIDPNLTNEIRGDIANAERPKAGQVPKIEQHIVQPNNSILELLNGYPSISAAQYYANNKGRKIDRTQQPKEQEHQVAEPVKEQDNYEVRSSDVVQTEER